MDRTAYRYDLEYRAEVRARLFAFATNFLAGKLRVIETARGLSEFSEIEPVFWEPLRVFVGINSETDALPVGDVRQQWDPKALESKDKEIAAAERHWEERARNAAKDLLTLLQTHP